MAKHPWTVAKLVGPNLQKKPRFVPGTVDIDVENRGARTPDRCLRVLKRCSSCVAPRPLDPEIDGECARPLDRLHDAPQLAREPGTRSPMLV